MSAGENPSPNVVLVGVTEGRQQRITGAMVQGVPQEIVYHPGDPPPAEHISFVHRFLMDVLDGYNRVRFSWGQFFHEYICLQYGFTLEHKDSRGVLPGGRHLFYVVAPRVQTVVTTWVSGLEESSLVLWKVLLRVKTTGSRERPWPHMTVSAATGLSWKEERYKYNYLGLPVPKNLPNSDPRKDYWANTCHFDFKDSRPALPLPRAPSAGGSR